MKNFKEMSIEELKIKWTETKLSYEKELKKVKSHIDDYNSFNTFKQYYLHEIDSSMKSCLIESKKLEIIDKELIRRIKK